jgi:hypothetical protein
MANGQERRRFPRLDIAEEARVFDENGRELGVVSKASGSGLEINTISASVAESLEAGRRLRITITEPGSRASNVMDVIVRQRQGSSVGMEFIDLTPAEPLEC